MFGKKGVKRRVPPESGEHPGAYLPGCDMAPKTPPGCIFNDLDSFYGRFGRDLGPILDVFS